MTITSHWLDEFDPPVPHVEGTRTLRRFTVEAFESFGVVTMIGIGACGRITFATLGVGLVLTAFTYVVGHPFGAHSNSMIAPAAGMSGRTPFGLHWVAQPAAGLCAAIATRRIVDSGHPAMHFLREGHREPRIGAELLFVFVLAYVVISGTGRRPSTLNMLWHFAVGATIGTVTVESAASFRDVYLLSQVIAGAFTGLAYLIFGSAAPMMRIELHVWGAKFAFGVAVA